MNHSLTHPHGVGARRCYCIKKYGHLQFRSVGYHTNVEFQFQVPDIEILLQVVVGMVQLCRPYGEGITCLCDQAKAVLKLEKDVFIGSHVLFCVVAELIFGGTVLVQSLIGVKVFSNALLSFCKP